MKKSSCWQLLWIVALCLWLIPSLTFAASMRKVTSFQSQVVTEGRQRFLRIEIGMNGPINDYEVKGDGILNPNRLTIDVDQAEKGDVRTEILLDRQFAKTLRFQETGKKLRILNFPRNNFFIQIQIINIIKRQISTDHKKQNNSRCPKINTQTIVIFSLQHFRRSKTRRATSSF